MSTFHALPITVLTVDEHPLFQHGVASVLTAEPDLYLVGQTGCGTDALALYRALRPAVTLMDVQMPGLCGVATIEAICREFPAARIIALGALDGEAHAVRAVKAGAVGYLLKSAMGQTLLDTIRHVHGGGQSIPPSVRQSLSDSRSGLGITSRELDVLQLVACGNSNLVIAATLGISNQTVKGYVSNILRKLDAHDRAHAVMIALERGILGLPQARQRVSVPA